MVAVSWSRSSQSTSGRGVITPRTERSPSRITRAIIRRSCGSTTPAVSASAIMARISSSVTTCPASLPRPRSRSTRVEETSSSHTAGAAIRATVVIGPATSEATRSGLASAICFGTSSPTISDR